MATFSVAIVDWNAGGGEIELDEEMAHLVEEMAHLVAETFYEALQHSCVPSLGIPKSFCLIPKYCGLIPKYCGLIPKYCGLIPKYCGLIPKHCGLVLKPSYLFLKAQGVSEFSAHERLAGCLTKTAVLITV
jgi:hypothetical protein